MGTRLRLPVPGAGSQGRLSGTPGSPVPRTRAPVPAIARARALAALLAAFLVAMSVAGCGREDALAVGAIPDQDPEVLQRRYGELSAWLEEELGIPVRYVPVTDYAAAVTAFRVGDLDLVWFGGLTGVQARLQVPGARVLVQREIDRAFRSVFIAHRGAGIDSVTSVEGLRRLAGRTFTFGSESSTSGRLMPQHFLERAGVSPEDFRGEPGFSGSHDRTLQLVEAGSYEAGALNARVWRSRLEVGRVDTSRVRVIWVTPPYHDYHWVARPGLEARFGPGFYDRLREAFLGLGPEDGPREARILAAFGAERFVPTEASHYARIESVARRIGKIR